MTYGAECWAVRKKDENRIHVVEIAEQITRSLIVVIFYSTVECKKQSSVNVAGHLNADSACDSSISFLVVANVAAGL